MTLQEQIMKALHVQPVIDPKVEIRKRVDFLKDYVKKTGAKGFVLGISGVSRLYISRTLSTACS